MPPQAKIFEAIEREQFYQDMTYPRPDGRGGPRPVGEWILILLGEIQAAHAAWLKGDLDAARQEILQVAAFGVACLEEHGVQERLHEIVFEADTFPDFAKRGKVIPLEAKDGE